MAGKHQIRNALTAIEAMNAVKPYFYISDDDIYNGIEGAVVPSRCQIVRRADPMIIIDGAHNPDGMNALCEFIKTLRCSPKVMLCGMLEDKDWERCAEIISPCVDKVYCVDGFFKNAVYAPKLASKFPNSELVSLSDAYYTVSAYAGKGGLAVICGSLYLTSAISRYSIKV